MLFNYFFMKTQLECIVRGRVQGVMFRDFVKRRARGLNIVGTVENQPDGSVKVVAVGLEDNLKKLLELLQKGPILTRIKTHIDSVNATWSTPTQSFSNFEIIY
jgi:acylphosphatase